MVRVRSRHRTVVIGAGHAGLRDELGASSTPDRAHRSRSRRRWTIMARPLGFTLPGAAELVHHLLACPMSVTDPDGFQTVTNGWLIFSVMPVNSLGLSK